MPGLSRRRLIVAGALGALGALSTLVASTSASAAPDIPCTRVGQRVISGGYVYACVRVKGELRWRRRGRAPAALPPSDPAPSPTASPDPTAGPSPAAGIAVASLSSLPQGRALVVAALDGQGRPAEFVLVRDGGRVRAFDARCTHSGCIVAVDGTELVCRCHASAFDGLTGERLSGPAPRGLIELGTGVVDGRVFVMGS